jgi:hypothetical protein
MISPRDLSTAEERSDELVATLWPTYALTAHIDESLTIALRSMDQLVTQPVITRASLDTLRGTALLVRTVQALDGSAHAALLAHAQEVARALAAAARAPWMREALLWRPAESRDVAFAHLVLTASGRPDAVFQQTLVRASAATTSQSGERLPHDRMRHAWLALLTEPSRDPLDGLADRTAVASPIDLCASRRDDLLAVVDGLQWVTDVGRRVPRLVRSAAVILDEMESALAIAVDAGDMPLTTALLMTWPMLRTPCTAAASFAFHWIAAQSPSRRDDPITSCTFGTLCALAAAGPWRPLTHWPPDASRAPLWNMLRERLDRAPAPSWLTQLDAMPWERQRGVTTLLLDSELRRAIAARDRGAIREIVQAVEANGARGTALTQQAAALLGRLEYEQPTPTRQPDPATPLTGA